MSNGEILEVLVLVLIFASVALLAQMLASGMVRQKRQTQRFNSISTMSPRRRLTGNSPYWLSKVDPSRFGLKADAQRLLRTKLVRAGYFNADAIVIFTLAKFVLLILLPLIGVMAVATMVSHSQTTANAGLVAVLVVIAYYLPRAFVSRRQRLLQDRYRIAFPDLLDMLVVCVNAGLSLDAALDRVTRELGPNDTKLRANLNLMAGEMRAGKSTIEALKDLAERLGLPEARSLTTLLQQSIELGTDVAMALTTFSDEMRDKRMARAEEKAAALPPKLTFPLAAFIFPVVLMVILTPIVLKIMRAAGN